MRETQAAAAGWGNGSLALPPGDGGATDWCRRRKGIGGGWEWRRRALGELRDTGIGEIDEKPKLPRREKLFSTGRSDARLIQNRPAATGWTWGPRTAAGGYTSAVPWLSLVRGTNGKTLIRPHSQPGGALLP